MEHIWNEKYRPKKVDDCILPDRLKVIFQKFVDEKTIPNLMLTGGPGTGKTTVALAMCKEIGLNYLFINSSEERGIDTLRVKIKGYASTVSLDGNKKVIILDEADYITPEAQAALRGAMEEFSSNCSFILTCNFKSKLIEAIHSRCSVIDFSLKNGEKARIASLFYRKLGSILSAEGVDFESKSLAKFVERYFPDFRRTINELQRFSKFGKIDSGLLPQISGTRLFDDLIGFLREKNFNSMRKWVAENKDVDPSILYRQLYDGSPDFVKPESIPQMIIILAKYQYQSAFVADQEINTVAMLTEIMVDVDFKNV